MNGTDTPRVPLYDRLPEIYRQRDLEQNPPGLLKAYLAIVENAFGAIYDNINELYSDLFIETCDAWVIPYIGDLLGTTPLSGPTWTLRADVADTIPLRRRKGTLHALELLAFDLTEWASYCIEMRDTLAWSQNLNHQRPDVQATLQGIEGVAHGGTATIRDPAMLSLVGTPFDPFAYTPDVKPVELGVVRHNLPLVAIYLWRLIGYQAGPSAPVWRATTTPPAGAARAVRFDMEPTGKPIQLSNISRMTPSAESPMVSNLDQVPGPLLEALLTTNSPVADPLDYVSTSFYVAGAVTPLPIPSTGVALQFYLPTSPFSGSAWTFRGANLCAWETSLVPPLQNREIAIDPEIGRVVFGVNSAAEALALKKNLLVNYAYEAPGPVGAQPNAPPLTTASIFDGATDIRVVQYRVDPLGLQHALDNLQKAKGPVVITIEDSLTHVLDLNLVQGVYTGDAVPSLQLVYPLLIQAADGCRPVVELVNSSMAFRPVRVKAGGGLTQVQVDAQVANLVVELQGIYLNGDQLPAGQPLIARAALPALNFANCTLDPGSYVQLSGVRSASMPATMLDAAFGFTQASELNAFKPTPAITLCRTISGPLLMESGYQLQLSSSIIDAGAAVDQNAATAIAIGSAANPVTGSGPVLNFDGITIFGQTLVRSACGSGGIFCHTLDAEDNQVGCIRFSYFSAEANNLPQNFGCVTGTTLSFVGESFGVSGYGQLSLDCDQSILEKGPGSDEMGAYGFLQNAHKWRNLGVRLREFVPVGVEPLLLPVT